MDFFEYSQELEECRLRLAQLIDVEEVCDEVWGYVVRLGLANDAILRNDPEAWNELKMEARSKRQEILKNEGRIIPPGRSKGKGSRSVPDEIAIEPSEGTNRRAEVFAAVAASLAENQPNVRRFRRLYLAHRKLTTEEARIFLDERCGGPKLLARHFKPSSRDISEIELAKKVGQKAVAYQLWTLVQSLCGMYRWNSEDAIYYVLTGNVPSVKPILVSGDINQPLLFPKPRQTQTQGRGGSISVGEGDYSRPYRPSTARITISADAWVDAREISDVFRQVQKQILGRDQRPISERTLRVVEFIAHRMREFPNETWEERRRAWNKSHPEETYRDYRSLIRAFERFTYKTYNFPIWANND